jgi:hypothetical protein
MRMKTLAVMAFAVALGAVGCRNQNGAGGTGGGETGTTGDTTLGGRAQTDTQSGTERMSTYMIESIEGDNVRLRPQGMSGDVQTQSGREITMSKDEFQRLAGSEAKEGTMVQVQLGDDGKPQKIQHQSGGTQGGGNQDTGGGTSPR